jgi:hypothetical protein
LKIVNCKLAAEKHAKLCEKGRPPNTRHGKENENKVAYLLSRDSAPLAFSVFALKSRDFPFKRKDAKVTAKSPNRSRINLYFRGAVPERPLRARLMAAAGLPAVAAALNLARNGLSGTAPRK